MADSPNSTTRSPADLVRPLVRVRQLRQFTQEPVDRPALDAIADAARWSGSSSNSQPWRFILVRDEATRRRLSEVARAKALLTAPAAIAISIPEEPESAVMHAYDEGRAAERILVAANLVGLGAGIAWVLPDRRQEVRDILGLPDGQFVRTVVAIGHPAAEALLPKSAPGMARLPRSEVVFKERWGRS